MSTSIKTSCPDCGEIRLKENDIVVRTIEGQHTGQYRFWCPKCHQLIIKDASDRIVQILIDGGVKHEVFTLPLELTEHPIDAPTINLDDLIDFGLALQDENWPQRLKED